MKQRKIPLLVVVGPTACGKTALSIRLAETFHGEIVSADSMQIYQGMPLATAAPTQEERRRAVHHMVEFLPAETPFSVADYVGLASACIRDVDARGILPILVGGTGLYVDTLLDYPGFVSEKPDPAVRASLEQEWEAVGATELLRRLTELDPETAAHLHENDRRRILRAFEVYRTTGLTLSEQNRLSRDTENVYEPVRIGLAYADRNRLYERINQRVDAMLQNGLVDEARAMLHRGKTAAQAIGHKELIPYFEGRCSLDEAAEHLKQQTRRYAKRQMTWFRRDERIHWILCDEGNPYDQAVEWIQKEGIGLVQK